MNDPLDFIDPGAARDTVADLAVKLADAALIARERGDEVHALFFAQKATELLQLARLIAKARKQ